MSGEAPLLSVVIPSRDRPERLVENLVALAGQEIGGALEVIVVDDGSATPCAALSSALLLTRTTRGR